jgi:hypothetical protein
MIKEEEIVELDDNVKSFIPVTKDMRLSMSPRNWQLQRKRMNKGVEEWEGFRYYMTLENAVKDIIHVGISKENFDSLASYAQAQNKVLKHIAKQLSPEYKLEKVV